MNKSINTYRKSILEIVVSNLLNLSNIILYIVAGVAVAFNLILALVVFFIALVNIFIGLFIDIKARASLNKITDEINLDETIVNKLSKIKSPHSQLLKALNKTLIIVGASTLLVIILMLISFAVKGEFNGQILSTYLALVTPVGLFLMINLAFVITTINLARKKVKTQDLYALEMIAKVDTVCFSKTGVLADNELAVKKVVIFDGRNSEAHVSQIISNILKAVEEETPLTKALNKLYDFELTSSIKASLDYNYDSHCFGASFTGNKTFLIGLPKYMNIKNKSGVLKRCEEFTNEGLSVYILAQGTGEIVDAKYEKELEALAMIVVQENIKENMSYTINWLINNGIDVKVISEDSVERVSSIAYEAGLKSATKCVSLENLSIMDAKKMADQYVVFGKVSPEQKDAIVETLQESGKKVMMIGASQNNVLAMKRADVSAAPTNASRAAQNMAQVILKDNDLSVLPTLVETGRSLSNNIQRIVSLFVSKLLFMTLLTFVFALASMIKTFEYPLSLNHLYLWDITFSLITSFLLIFDKNPENKKGKYLTDILLKSLPGILIFIAVTAVFTLYTMQQHVFVSFGLYSIDIAVAMSVIIIGVLGILTLYNISTPLNKYRYTSLIVSGAAVTALLVVPAVISYTSNKPDPIFGISFMEMNGPAYFVTTIIIIAIVAVYLLIYNIAKIVRKDD